MVREGDVQAGSVAGDFRRLEAGVAAEKHSAAPRGAVIVLKQPVHPHIPVEDDDVHVRVEILQGDGVLYGSLAADAAAVGVLVVA